MKILLESTSGRFGVGSEHQYEIVGIAKDARHLSFDFDKPVTPFFFQPEVQQDIDPKTGSPAIDPSHFLQDIVIVTRPGVGLPITQIRGAMASVDANLPIISIHTLREQVASQFTQQRLIARLTSFFGVLSLVLASIGLYGVTAYNAGSRTSEIGVRMALGAHRSQVVALVLRGAFGLILFGLLIGLPLTFAAHLRHRPNQRIERECQSEPHFSCSGPPRKDSTTSDQPRSGVKVHIARPPRSVPLTIMVRTQASTQVFKSGSSSNRMKCLAVP